MIFEDLRTQYLSPGHDGKNTYLIFLSLGAEQSDPSKDLLAYSVRTFSRTRPLSAAIGLDEYLPRWVSFGRGVVEKETGRPGAILWIDDFRIENPNLLKIRAREFTNGTAAEEFEYRVWLRDGKWRVLGRTTLSVS